MKNILFITVAILSIALLVSCEDSLGIDPNYQKKPVISNPTDTTQKSTIYEITNKKWIFFEEFFIDNRHTDIFEWYNNVNYQRNSVQIDTSNNDYYLWVDLEAECTYPDDIITNRDDRITGVRLVIDSLKIESGIDEININNYDIEFDVKFRLFVKDLKTGISNYYTEDQLFNFFELKIDRVRKIITIRMPFWLINIKNQPVEYDTYSLKTFVTLHYGE